MSRVVWRVGLLLAVAAGAALAEDGPCSAPGYRQFDFWLGDWTVISGDRVAGTNRVSSILDGCVVLEEYTTPTGFAGRSFNRYDPQADGWEQVWVDNRGAILRLAGGLEDGQMLLSGTTKTPEGSTRHRIRWSVQMDGTVRQLWEQSSDGGKSWTVAFDGTYSRK